MNRGILIFVAVACASLSAVRAADRPLPYTDSSGTVHAPAFVLPPSALLSPQARGELEPASAAEDAAPSKEPCPRKEDAEAAQVPGIRQCEIDVWHASGEYKALFEHFGVQVAPQQVAGVYTDVFTPKAGVAVRNRNRVLINLHGGGFLGGARISSDIESVPIASVGRIKVISVDYRMAPQYTFPAASEDVAAVYRELLKQYRPENIGIFGCSAGGLLTAQSVAWLAKEKLPRPGAVAMLCEGGFFWMDGDSGVFERVIEGTAPEKSSRDNLYLKNAAPDDPLAFPASAPAVLAKFPPSLLVSATRDTALSSVVRTHSLLVAQGVEAELHVWEGLGHAFQYATDFPESREVFAVVARFFDRHLGS